MKIGTIGSGPFAEKFINATKENENVDVVACYSRTMTRAEEFAKNNGLSKFYDSIDEMLKDDEINCVFIASPNSLHYSQTKKALLAGKHVICEKPFMSNVKECQECIEIAKEKKLFLFEAVTTIHLPNYKWIKENLGRIGDIKMIQLNFSQYSSRYDAFKRGENPNTFNPDFSGGALMDLNVYNIHFATGLFGTPKKVQYFANMKDGIDTSGVAILEYDGFIANCVACKDSNSKSRIQIQGELGYITIEEKATSLLCVEMYLKSDVYKTGLQEKLSNMFYEAQDFSKIFQEKDYDECYRLLDHSYDVMQVLDKARACIGLKFKSDEM